MHKLNVFIVVSLQLSYEKKSLKTKIKQIEVEVTILNTRHANFLSMVAENITHNYQNNHARNHYINVYMKIEQLQFS